MLQDGEIGAVTTGGPFGQPPQSKYENLISLVKEVPPATTVVTHPCAETSLRGAVAAAEVGIIVPILVGPVAKITAVAKQHGIDIARYELVDAPHSEAAAAKAVDARPRQGLLVPADWTIVSQHGEDPCVLGSGVRGGGATRLKEIALTFAREGAKLAKLAIADLNKLRPDRSRTKLPMPEVGRWPSSWM